MNSKQREDFNGYAITFLILLSVAVMFVIGILASARHSKQYRTKAPSVEKF